MNGARRRPQRSGLRATIARGDRLEQRDERQGAEDDGQISSQLWPRSRVRTLTASAAAATIARLRARASARSSESRSWM